MRKYFSFSILSLFLFSCSSFELPTDQTNFTEIWKDLKSKSNTDDAETHLNQKLSFKNWYGEVIEVGSDWITVKADGIKYYLYPQGSEVNYSDFNKNMELLFSGTLNGNYWLDSIKKPGLYVNCDIITDTDRNHVYFTITEQEILAKEERKRKEEKRKKIREEKERREKEGLCSLPGCPRKGKGWSYYGTSQGTAFGYEMTGCLKKWESGGCCSKDHCAEYHANYLNKY